MLGMPRLARNFTPHVTVAYGNRTVSPRDIEPVAWQVPELRLIHSLRGPTRHVVMARWPLAS
jgi:2'-5' RNA ligase